MKATTTEITTTYQSSIEFARKMDKKDPLSAFRETYSFPHRDGKSQIYLCGNSLGLQPKKAQRYVQEEMEDWAAMGVEGHFHARHPWMPYHEYLTKPMAAIVGGQEDEVVVMNSLTVNLHLMMVSFYRPTKRKYKILIEHDIFPSDLYVVESQIRFHGFDPEDAIIWWQPNPGAHTLQLEDYAKLMEVHGDSVALVFIGGVNYYTGQAFDMREITRIAHKHGALAGFDLAHAAGNIMLSLHADGVDFAAWCTYKYLNSGPGSLSGVFIHERHARDKKLLRFAGWWGHNKETRFKMRDPFDPIPGAEGWQLSNPPILPMAAMRAALELFDQAGMHALVAKSKRLTGFLEYLLKPLEKAGHLEIITPRDPQARGCQLSVFIEKQGNAIFKKVTDQGVVADWREPNVIRVAPVPMYNSFEDVWHFSKILNTAIITTEQP